MSRDNLIEEARRLAAVAHSQTKLVLSSATDAEREAAEHIGANALHRRERKLSGLTGLAEPESAPTLSRSSRLKGGSHDDGPTTLHHVRDVEAHKQRRLPLNETDIRKVKRKS